MELRSAQDYAQWARTIPDHPPVAETAKGVCILRGVDPYEYVGAMVRWRHVATEALLMAAIARDEPKLR